MAEFESVKDLAGIAGAISRSYEENAGRCGPSPEHLPGKSAVAEILELGRRLLFPGYFDDGGTARNRAARTDEIVRELFSVLQAQICRALFHDPAACGGGGDPGARSEEIALEFLSRIPEIRGTLLTDVQAAFDGDPAAKDKHEVIFAYPGLFAVSVFRMAHELFLLGVPLIPRMMTEHAHSATGIDIHPGAKIGGYFFIDHGTGVVVGETTEIGSYVKIYQGVTLGALSTRGGQGLRGKKRHPTIGDEVTVYSGASILGGESVIGRGCVIGSNVFLTKSLPPYTRVTMKAPELSYKELGQNGK